MAFPIPFSAGLSEKTFNGREEQNLNERVKERSVRESNREEMER